MILEKEYQEFMSRLEQREAKELENYADFLADEMKDAQIEGICINHALEWYLYCYYEKKEEVREIPYAIHIIYKQAAVKYGEKARFEKVEECLKKALYWNKTDVETSFSLVRFYQQNNSMEQMKQCLENVYPYLFTKTDMATYYRYMGCYYLEKYEPELAMALYQYSELFVPSNMAQNEMKYLKQAVPSLNLHMEEAVIQKILQNGKLPLQPSNVTLGMMYHIGKQSLDGDKMYGNYLLKNLYELTGDEEIGAMLS